MATAKRSRRQRDLVPVHPNAAALDIGAKMHMAAVKEGSDPEPVRAFGTFTGDLHRLADWFGACGVRTVAMESTGVYWIAAYEVLEQRGFEVVLVNARDAKHVPGRKTDLGDAQWLRRLHEYGLLRGSFRPEGEIAMLRAYMRQRERLVEHAAAHIQHMQKALTQMNLQLHHVVSDVTGVTGMKIIRAIVAGERDPIALAAHTDPRCRSSAETIRRALEGNDREEHVFALAQALDLYDAHREKAAACDVRIEAVLRRLADRSPRPARALPPARHTTRQANAPAFDARRAARGAGHGPDPDPRAWPLAGAEARRGVRDRPVGLAKRQALHLVAVPRAEQQDLRRQGAVLAHPSDRQPGRGAAAARGHDAGPHTVGRTRWAAHGGPHTVGRTETALGAFHRRLSARIGKAKAVTATARKIAVLFYNALRHGMNYVDPGAASYEERHRRRVLVNLQRRAKTFGFVLQKAAQPSEVAVP